MSNRLMAGIVARIRVNPKDSQSILDLLDSLGIARHSMSFSGCVSMALASLLETARLQKLLPEPDPFQYINRLGSYVGNGNAQQKVRQEAATQMGRLGRLGERFIAPTLAGGARPAEAAGGLGGSTGATNLVEDNAAENAYAKSRLSQLVTEKDMAENGMGNWTEDKEAEFQLLYKIVYPHG